MARITDKLKKTIWSWTNACYVKALLEYYPEIFADNSTMDEIDMKHRLLDLDLPYNNQEIGNIYLKHVTKLESDQLNLILEAHKKGKIKRAEHTLQMIMNELLERSANPETKG